MRLRGEIRQSQDFFTRSECLECSMREEGDAEVSVLSDLSSIKQ